VTCCCHVCCPGKFTYKMRMPNLVEQFKAVLNKQDVTEQDAQEFLEKNTQMFYPAFELNHGVHCAAVISKFQLDTSLICDFAYLTKSSNEWWLVFVELEHPKKELFTEANVSHSKLTAAIAQVNTWRTFVERNGAEIIRKLAPIRKPLATNQVYFKYILVIGRREQYASRQASVDALNQMQKPDFRIMTYDSLISSYEAGSKSLLDVISQKGQKYAVKYHHRNDTLMFMWLSQNDISLDGGDIAYYKSHGYDMDAWVGGKMLEYNGKDTLDKFVPQFTKQLADGNTQSNTDNH